MLKLGSDLVDPSLAWAASRGYLLLPDRCAMGATAAGGVLRYDPRLSPADLRAAVEFAVLGVEPVE